MSFFDKFKRKKTYKIDIDTLQALIKASRTSILNTQSGSTKWTPDNYQNFVEETYKKNLIAYRAMFQVAEAFSSVTWQLFRKDGTDLERVTDHEIIDLLKRPNPDESFAYLLLKWVVYLQANGNSFIERVRINNNTYPKELYVLRPDQFTIELDEATGQIKAYVYNDGIVFEVDPITHNADILQVKLFDPLNEFWGMSPIKPSMREIDTSNEAIEWQKKILQNEGRPGLVLNSEGLLSDDQFARLEKMLNDRHSGSANAGSNLVLEGKMSVTPYNWSPKELDFIESNRELSRKIVWAFGVPPVLMGIQGDSTFKNYETARLAFWEETIVFYLNLFRSEFNNWLFAENEDNLFLNYNLDDVSALASKRDLLWERAEKSSFLTVNEKREMVGKESVEGGDVILVNANQVPLSVASSEELDEEEEVDEEEKTINNLISEGYNEEEARSMISDV